MSAPIVAGRAIKGPLEEYDLSQLELAGMVWRGDNRRARGSLMFDQYTPDQTVGIQYSEANGRRMAGLRVWDRPDWSIKPLMEMLAGVPTVVYGFFAALTVAPFIRDVAEAIGLEASSQSALAAGLVSRPRRRRRGKRTCRA